jgi:arylsulfatase A-like enzyme
MIVSFFSLSSSLRAGGASVAALILVSVACGPTQQAVEYIDLVADRSFTNAAGPLPISESVCWDETYNTIAIDSSSTVSATVALGEDPVLHLGGALDCGRDFGTEDEEAVILGGVFGSADKTVPIRIEFNGASGWWSDTTDLKGFSGTRVEIELASELPDGCVVRVNDAFVRQKKAIEISEPRPQQILLISVDTLRADSIEDQNVLTPSLDILAEQGERWTRHYAAATWTKPSHASMLTGFAPQTHRALDMRDPIAGAIPTLAQRFLEAEFETAALVFDTAWLSSRWGFSKGFDEYRIARWRVDREMRAAANWLVQHRNDSFFYFLHTFEPHSDHSILPYEAPGVSRRTIATEFGLSDYGCRRQLCASRFLIALDRGKVGRRPKDPKILRRTYLDGVRFTDQAIGSLITALQESGIWDDLLVVFTSDHGEAFGEHGRFSHSSLHEEIIRVPLIIKWPRGARAGQKSDVPSSSLDLAPTLLEYAGLSADALPGTHLHRRTPEQPVFAGTFSVAVVLGPEKAIFAKSGDLEELYDLADDPRETDNILDSPSNRLGELDRMRREWLKQSRALARKFGVAGEAEVALSERDRERLQAFGYLE